MHPSSHPAQDDVAAGAVTWDGTCVDDGANSYALLSNGWKPYFQGHSACVIALDPSPACGAPAACSTRITYGATWVPPANHPAQYDDVGDRVFWNGDCQANHATLSNGWAPHFSSGCAMSFAYTGCGGLYANPTIPTGCADPGVTRDGNLYVLSCTGGGGGNAYPMFTSTDLAVWTPAGHIFSPTTKPSWAKGNFWAPEIHKVGSHWVAYFSALDGTGRMSIGAASAPSSTGPFTDLGHPIVTDANVSLIDANELTTSSGASYLLFKEDGNAQGKPTPIHAQALAADGLSLTGARATLITNDQSWEGNLVEGPFLVEHAGEFFLFYSGNAYYDGRYAVGVARASSPLGPFTKAAAPIVVTGGDWVGPGHCSVVDGPGGDSYMIYHAWRAGHVNGPGDQRLTLTDQVVWSGGWPAVPGAPSSASRPLP
jgi:beta-xylosidase